VTVNEANANALSINSAYISGGGTITARDVTVRAKTVSEANAIARKSLSVALVTIGSLAANAATGDSVSAYISGCTVETFYGDVTVTAIGSTTAYALCEEAGA
jgi:hypothetical protein